MACSLLFKNVWEIGTLTTDSEESLFPVTNTQDFNTMKTWRSEDVSGAHWIVCDRGTNNWNIDSFVMKYNNLTVGAEVKLQANSSNSWSSPPIDVTLAVYNDVTYYKFDTSQSYRYWRVLVTDTSNTDGYYEIGYIFLGTENPLSKIYSYQYKIDHYDNSARKLNSYGFPYGFVRNKIYRRGLKFSFLNDSDKAVIDALFSACGYLKPFFFISDSYSVPSSIFLNRMTKSSMTFIFNNFWDWDVELETVL